MTEDTIFRLIEQHQGARPWGSVIDAGTGPTSLAWVSALPARSWCAVTYSAGDAEALARRLPAEARRRGRVLAGNWLDPEFQSRSSYDVVIADYLLGALDAYAPYQQSELLIRLNQLTGDRLYLVGKEPLPRGLSEAAVRENPQRQLVVDIENLRDACIALAGHRCHREYPLTWVQNELGRAGFRVERVWTLGILYGSTQLETQLEVCRRKLGSIAERGLASALERRVEELMGRVRGQVDSRIPLGFDYVISATPRSTSPSPA